MKGKKQLIEKQRKEINKFGTFTTYKKRAKKRATSNFFAIVRKKFCRRKSSKSSFNKVKKISLKKIKNILNGKNIQHNNRYGSNKLVVL